jgi:hypothetical protein
MKQHYERKKWLICLHRIQIFSISHITHHILKHVLKFSKNASCMNWQSGTYDNEIRALAMNMPSSIINDYNPSLSPYWNAMNK